MIDDKILYKKFLDDDITAYEKLVLSHKDNLIYFISRYTGGDIHIAEDIAQDVFAYVYVYKEKYDFKYTFKTFIYTLGKNKAIDYIRKQSKLNLYLLIMTKRSYFLKKFYWKIKLLRMKKRD